MVYYEIYFSQSEHGVAHLHAIFGECNEVFAIEDLEMMEEDLPLKIQKLIKK